MKCSSLSAAEAADPVKAAVCIHHRLHFNDHFPGEPMLASSPLISSSTFSGTEPLVEIIGTGLQYDMIHYLHAPKSWRRFSLICRMEPKNKTKKSNEETNKPVGFYGPIAPPVRNAPELRSLHAASPPVQSQYPAERHAAAAVPLA